MENKKSSTTLESDDLITLAGFYRLGCGYDIFGEYASPRSMQRQVFDLTPFLDDTDATVSFKEKNYRFPKQDSGYFYFNSQVDASFIKASGTSIRSFRENVSNSFNGEGVIEAFTGSFSIADSKSIYQEDSFAYSLMFRLENNYIIDVAFDKIIANSNPYLVGLFQTMVDEVQTLEEGLNLMKRYGTHVVTRLSVGKRKTQYASVSKHVYESIDDFQATAQASFAEIIGIKDEYEDKKALHIFNTKAYTYEHSYGSDAQNTIIAFPTPDSLVPIWQVYKDPNHSISNAFSRLVKAYQFITSILGRGEKFVTAIDFNYDAYELHKKGFTVIKDGDSPIDMRENLGGEYIYMGIKKSSLLEVLEGEKPVTKIIKTTSKHSHPKPIEGYTPIHCDFLQSVSYSYEYTYYQQIDLSLSKELTTLLAIGNSYNYTNIKEQAYAYATDDKFPIIEQGIQALKALKEREGEAFGDLLFSSRDAYMVEQAVQDSFNPNSTDYYEKQGYTIISDNLVDPGSYGNYLYILGKPLQA
ncbi:MAG: hypothetical protein ACRBFS_02510 [Aureispira sp.]